MGFLRPFLDIVTTSGSIGLPLGLIFIFVSGYLILRRREDDGPPWLPEKIPFVTNTYEYLTDMGSFLDRAT
jgi:hypothetical protein